MGIPAIIIHMDTAVITNEARPQRLGRRLVFMALLVPLMVVGFCSKLGSAELSKLDGFAQCLAAKRVTMYGSFLCPHCDDQKKLFGRSFRLVPYVECSARGSRQMTFPCLAAQIRFTPTWIFSDGDRRIGVQPLKDLGEKTGCKLP